MLIGVVIHGKMVIGAILAVMMVVALVIYLPIALVKEVTREENEELPEWMGTVKGRRTRLRVLFGVLGALAVTIVLAVAMKE